MKIKDVWGKVNGVIGKFPFVKMAEKIPEGARTKAPFLNTLIPLANHIAGGAAIVALVAVLGGAGLVNPPSVSAEIPAPQVGEDNAFISSTARDEWIQAVIREYPFYFIWTDNAQQDAIAATVAETKEMADGLNNLGAMVGEDLGLNMRDVWYMPSDHSAQGIMVLGVYILSSPRGPRAAIISFAQNRAKADELAANGAKAGGNIWGPFTHGSSARNARDTQKRIIDGVTSFIQYHNDKNPWN